MYRIDSFVRCAGVAHTTFTHIIKTLWELLCWEFDQTPAQIQFPQGLLILKIQIVTSSLIFRRAKNPAAFWVSLSCFLPKTMHVHDFYSFLQTWNVMPRPTCSEQLLKILRDNTQRDQRHWEPDSSITGWASQVLAVKAMSSGMTTAAVWRRSGRMSHG